MIANRTPYGFGATVALPFTDAVRRTTDALAAEGFGVLAEIDIGSALRQKLGVEFREYMILGAGRPSLARPALDAEPDAGLLLPCNVVVYTADDAEHCVVAALDPRAVLALSGNPALGVLAEDAAARLRRAIDAVVGVGAAASTP
jgi:uncharacterized protein (DUF302 family)